MLSAGQFLRSAGLHAGSFSSHYQFTCATLVNRAAGYLNAGKTSVQNMRIVSMTIECGIRPILNWHITRSTP